jgi:hypothetical protein
LSILPYSRNTREHSMLEAGSVSILRWGEKKTLTLLDPLETVNLNHWVWVLYYNRPSVSLSWNKAPIWGLRPNFYFCQTVAGLLMWGALSDERRGLSFTIAAGEGGLSFTIAAGPRQRSHSRVPVPWDLRPYFTVSHLRLPFLSPPTTRKVMVEVFDPTSTWVTSTHSITERLTAI